MLLNIDSNDSTVHNMFSKQGRKLNKFFINLHKKYGKSTESNSDFPHQNSQNVQKSLHKLHPNPSKENQLFSNQVEPFNLMTGRDNYVRLQQKKVHTPLFGNYNPRSIGPKLKMLVNIELDKTRNNKMFAISNWKLKSLNLPKNIPLNCNRFKDTPVNHHKTQSTLGTTGFIDFVKQKSRANSTKKSACEYDLEVLSAFNKTRPFERNLVSYKEKGRDQFENKTLLQRNNYALKIRRDLIEKKTVVNIPVFLKMISRKENAKNSFCFNEEFFYGQKIQKHSRSVLFKLCQPR